MDPDSDQALVASALFEVAAQAHDAGAAEHDVTLRLVAAARAGHGTAMAWLGDNADRKGDRQLAREWWTVAAESGIASAMYNLGTDYIETEELDQAVTWLSRAVDEGHPKALHNLGNAYYKLGDRDRARGSWMNSVEKHGNIESMSQLGVLQYERRDYRRAGEWWEMAAQRGSQDAMRNLGILRRQRLY